ncbi:MAG: Uma2 family endonuclease [Limnothrix sp. RL_2_0]|nr:Uma2 family endonuclease [Limnothrix sp. RL_2_0]
MVAAISQRITWEKLPDDYPLPDDPVDNINQPILAAALTESLQQAGKLSDQNLTPSNYGICATLDGKMVVKAPDWAFIPQITVPRDEVTRSYTPQLQGDIPLMVLEFLSDTSETEYSSKATYPPGKWFFYEQILKVPYYGLFEPNEGQLELYKLDEAGRYVLVQPNEEGHFAIPEIELSLGTWQGNWSNLAGYWLRWWDAQQNLLLWGSEAAELATKKAELANDRAERLAAQLRAAGIEPEI